MNIFRFRPLALGCCLFILFSLVFLYTNLLFLIILCSISIVAGIIFLVLQIKKRRHFCVVALAICVLVILSAVASYFTFDYPYSKLESYQDEDVRVELVVDDILYRGSGYNEYRVKVKSINGKRMRENLSLTSGFDLTPGERLSATAAITLHDHDDISENSYDMSNKVLGSITLRDDVTFGEKSRNPIYFAKRINQSISNFFANHYKEDASSLMSAMLIGNRSNLDPIISYQFRRAGVSHLLALSGMHVSILCFAMAKLCQLLRVPRRPASISIISFLTIYAVLAGMSPSIIRASIMTGIIMLGRCLMREHDSLTSLCFAAALIAFFSPNARLDLGYWMSVFATLGILLVGIVEDALRRWKLKKQRPEDAVAEKPQRPGWFKRFVYYQLVLPILFTVSATLMTLPFSCFVFGEMSILFLLTNLVFPFLMTLFLYLALVTLPLWFLRSLTNLAATGYIALMGWVSNSPNILINLSAVYIKIALLLLLLSIVCFLVLKIRRKKAWVIVISSLFLVFCASIGISAYRINHDTSVHYASYRYRDDFIILHDEGKTVVSAISSSSYLSLKTPLSVLSELGENEIDILYLPHYHEEIGTALDTLVGKTMIHSICVLIPACDEEMQAYNSLALACERYGIDLFQLDGSTFTCGEIEVSALPRKESTKKEEFSNAAMRISVGDESILYFSAGYTTSIAFTPGKSPFDSSADVLIFGCHGSDVERKTPPNYPLTRETHTILRCAKDVGIALTDEEYDIYKIIDVKKNCTCWCKHYD